MEKLLLGIIAIPFLYLNYRIIFTDITEKKIPNICILYLACLLPVWYLYSWYFWNFSWVNPSIFFFQIFLTCLIWFWLFHFNIWWAWDAKYLLILGLFIPHIWVIPFIWNIALATLSILIVYFLWFWLGSNLWIHARRKNLYRELVKTKKEELFVKYRKKWRRGILFDILKWINIFLVIFISLRLIRIYVIDYIERKYDVSIFEIIAGAINSPYNILYLIAFIAAICWLLFLIRYIYTIVKTYIIPPYDVYVICWLSCSMLAFILYEYSKNPEYIAKKMFLIFTLYLWIYITFKILIYAYKIVFIVKEETFVNISDLQEWMMVDKPALKKALAPSKEIVPEKFLDNIKNPLNEESRVYIQGLYQQIAESRPDKNTSKIIKIVKTNPFSITILLGFTMTIFFWGSLITEAVIKILWLFMEG